MMTRRIKLIASAVADPKTIRFEAAGKITLTPGPVREGGRGANRGFKRIGLAALSVVAAAPSFAAGVSADPGLRDDPGMARHAAGPVRVLEDIVLPSGDLADLYLPRVPRGRARLFEDAFPLVALLQGAQVDKSQYGRVASEVAGHGFVVVVPNHPNPLFRGGLFTEVEVVTEVFDAAVAADEDPGSPLYQVVDTASMGLIGHSFGGAVGLYAIAHCSPRPFRRCDPDEPTYTPPEALRAGAFYGTHLVSGDEVTDLDTSGAAVALIQGTRDGVATPLEAQATYPVLESPRALVEIDGATHYGLCDEEDPAGATEDPNEPTIDQDVATREIARWMALWLGNHLHHRRDAEPTIARQSSASGT
ncbi:alpha/beta hydrolase family protein [Thiococcus pfennigii]|uniref:alpha/beta hydrolase family protein n=1 Tax=Thiococcus pfennigii TaxID=1057 RepID=UPI001902F79B|nr:hypothetical protein [Thiococcus pfennigii]MBK1730514.1 hypothetical protein [Thiococcus pfennigii]